MPPASPVLSATRQRGHCAPSPGLAQHLPDLPAWDAPAELWQGPQQPSLGPAPRELHKWVLGQSEALLAPECFTPWPLPPLRLGFPTHSGPVPGHCCVGSRPLLGSLQRG